MITKVIKDGTIELYYQHPFEEKSSLLFQNIPDGLYGISFKKTGTMSNALQMRRLTFEVLTTMYQGGFDYNIGSLRFNGANDYFNNYQYLNGWTYKSKVIGTPFLTVWKDSRLDLNNIEGGFGKMIVSNNRVQLIHMGSEWGVGNFNIKVLMSRSINFGRPIVKDQRLPKEQFSGLFQINYSFKNKGFSGWSAEVKYGLDTGSWLNNTNCVVFSISKEIL